MKPAGITRPLQQSGLLLLIMGTFGLALGQAFETHGYMVNDIQAAQYPAWNLVHRGTLDLSSRPLPVSIASELVSNKSHLFSDRPLGMILAAVPGQLFSDEPTGWGVAITAAFAAAATVGLIARLWGIRVALLCAAATPLLYTVGRTLWPELVCMPLLIGALMLLRADRRLWVLLPLVTGATLCRPVFGLLMVFVLVFARWRKQPALWAGAGFLLGIVVLFTYARVVVGRWSLLPGYAVSHSLHFDGLVTALISPARGLLWWTPWLLFVRPRGRSEWLILGTAVAYVVGSVLVFDGWGGDGFVGYRYPIPLAVLAAPMLRRPVSRLYQGLLYIALAWSVAVAVVAETLSFSLSRGRNEWHSGLPAVQTACIAVIVGALFVYVLVRIEPEIARRKQARESVVVS